MKHEFWEAVRQRAHALWLQEGCQEERSDQHWQQAQQDVLASRPAASTTADPPEEALSAEMSTNVLGEVETQPASDLEPSMNPDAAAISPAITRQQSQGTSLFKISSRQCRYIVSENVSPTIFCGAPTDGGAGARSTRHGSSSARQASLKADQKRSAS